MGDQLWTRRASLSLLLAGAAAGPALARSETDDQARSRLPRQTPRYLGTAESIGGDDLAALARERLGRMTVPVNLNGQGPFRFAIDTAASASVISRELANAMSLPLAGQLDMHSVLGLERVDSVTANDLASGALSRRNVRLAVGAREGLAGLDGLLGMDLLAEQRLVMQFRGQSQTRINRSRMDPDGFLGAPRSRVNFTPQRLVEAPRLLVMPAIVRGQAVSAVIDTGAQVSLINPVLAERANAQPFVTRTAETGRAVQSPTGRQATAEAMVVTAVHFDDVVIDRLAVLMGDFHIFRHLGLADEPAMLLGVDVLGAFDRVVIDLKRGELIMEV